MEIPFQFYNTSPLKLFSPPAQNAYGIMILLFYECVCVSVLVCLRLKLDASEKQQNIYWIRSVYFILVFILYCLCAVHWVSSLPRLLMAYTNWNTFGWAFFGSVVLFHPHGNCSPQPFTRTTKSKIANSCQWNVKHLTLSFPSTEFVMCMATVEYYIHINSTTPFATLLILHVCRMSF